MKKKITTKGKELPASRHARGGAKAGKIKNMGKELLPRNPIKMSPKEKLPKGRGQRIARKY